jgi:hypothetical protein
MVTRRVMPWWQGTHLTRIFIFIYFTRVFIWGEYFPSTGSVHISQSALLAHSWYGNWTCLRIAYVFVCWCYRGTRSTHCQEDKFSFLISGYCLYFEISVWRLTIRHFEVALLEISFMNQIIVLSSMPQYTPLYRRKVFLDYSIGRRLVFIILMDPDALLMPECFF